MKSPVVMGSQDLKQRLAPRAQTIVCRDGRILMTKHREGEAVYWCLPGGGLEDRVSPEDGVLRELREEVHVEGRIVRQANHMFGVQGIEQYTYLVDIGDQEEPALGHDPEVSPEDQVLVDLQGLSLEEIPERDRVFLRQAGLMSAPNFLEEVERWGDEISYPD